MVAIYLQEPLLEEEVIQLKKEFPQYDLLTSCSPSQWGEVEILYGNSLKINDFESAKRLKWIHCPREKNDLPLLEIEKRGTTLISYSKERDYQQVSEYVLGIILLFAKQFFRWKQAPHDIKEFWNWPLKETLWTLEHKTLLQIGLGEIGTAVAKQASSFGMRVWGVRGHRGFHPYCKKTFHFDAIHSLLPQSDVVVISQIERKVKRTLIEEKELNLMKNDSILIVVESPDIIDEEALIKVAATKKFRGLALDAFKSPLLGKHSPIWNIPDSLLTPAISGLPPKGPSLSFKIFRQNLRIFIQGKFNQLKNLMYIK